MDLSAKNSKMTYGELSVLYRRRKGWLTRAELAHKMGLPPVMVKKVEAGRLAEHWIPKKYKMRVARQKIREQDWLFIVRRRLGLTQAEFARLIGCGHVTYNNAESARYMRHLSYVLARVREYLQAEAQKIGYTTANNGGTS